MNGVESAGEEIERTLRAARDRAERRIAASRLAAFTTLFLVSVTLVTRSLVADDPTSVMPVFYTATLVAYALLLVLAVRRSRRGS